jgi:branched-chain amino acid transport system permease protein
MNESIALILAQDGLVTGAVYALLAIGLVLVFSVTRVIFIPQGELVSAGALTIAALQLNAFPKIIYLQMVLGAYVFVCEIARTLSAFRHLGLSAHKSSFAVRSGFAFLQFVVAPALLFLLVDSLHQHAALDHLGAPLQVLLTLLLVAPLGPMLYKAVFEPVSDASVLVLLIISVALHLSLMGLGLWMFGAEGGRSAPLLDQGLSLGEYSMSGQSLFVIIASLVLMVCFTLFFQYSMSGKALKAIAINRTGARLMGIRVQAGGQLAFFMAAFLGAFSGILIGPITTVYYDSGFIIGLKGFVGAILGALASYPLAGVAALGVGLLESYISFWASAYKEVWVFSIIIPVLMWRSFKQKNILDEDDSL